MSIMQIDSSVSHTFGNVACAILGYVKSFFQEDYFKTTHVSTKLAHKQLNVYRAKNEFWKNKKPMIIIKPRIDIDDNDNDLYGSQMTRVTNNKSNMVFECLPTLLENKEYGTMIRFQWNKLKITFDVALVVETYNQQIDKAIQLKNKIAPEVPYYFKTPLESYIPKTLIYAMADHLGIPRTNTREILFYLNTFAGTPITYKLKDGSGNDEFFMLYDTNIEIIPSQITTDDGESSGMVTDTYTISFSVTASFRCVGLWYLFLKNKNPEFIINSIGTELQENDTIVPICSIPLKYDLKLTPGWEVYSAPCYFISELKNDVTDLTSQIPESVANLILLTLKSGMELSDSFVRFICFEDTRHIHPKVDYDLTIEEDPKAEFNVSVKITTFKGHPKLTYRVFILVNNFAVNNICAEMTEFNKEK